MLITNKKHKKIVSELNDKFSELEKVLEEQVNKLDRLIGEIKKVKTASNEIVDLIDYKDNDQIISSITNFLLEQGQKKKANAVSKCKVGGVHLQELDDILSFQRKISMPVTVQLFCPGDSYDLIKKEIDGVFDDKKPIVAAFHAYFSPTYTSALYKKHFKEKPPSNDKGYKVMVNLEISVRRIDPKESDLELFFQRVDRLKEMLDKRNQ